MAKRTTAARVLAIDPGNENSAWVVSEGKELVLHGLGENEAGLLDNILQGCYDDCDVMAIEMIASYGMPVGKTVFETCVWIGRFVQAWGEEFEFVYRKDVKMHLCHSMRAKDSNVRQAIIDLYPPSGGGKCPQVGTKKDPGPLYGVSKDVWSALGVAITYAEAHKDIS